MIFRPNRTVNVPDIPQDDPRLKRIALVINSYGHQQAALIQVLHSAQALFGYLPKNILQLVARELHVPTAKVYGVATFYHFFSLKPKGEHMVVICTGTACYVKGAQGLLDAMDKAYGLKPGQNTADGKVGLEQARCIGACGLAPAVVIDEVMQPKLTADKMIELIKAKAGV